MSSRQHTSQVFEIETTFASAKGAAIA